MKNEILKNNEPVRKGSHNVTGIWYNYWSHNAAFLRQKCDDFQRCLGEGLLSDSENSSMLHCMRIYQCIM